MARISLRRWNSKLSCTGEYSYHNAEVTIDRQPARMDKNGNYEVWPMVNHVASQWPTKCDYCDYEFTDEDERQTNQRVLYVAAPGNEGVEPFEWTTGDMPAGVMYFPSWMQPSEDREMRGYVCPTDGTVLIVVTPNKPDWTGTHHWIVDAYCSNCERKGEVHHCWCRHYTTEAQSAPWITVDKVPPTSDNFGTCGAGAGSIWSNMPHGWHGFLRDGYLVGA